MMKKKVLLIGNPVAGRGRVQKLIDQFVQELELRGYQIETFLTRSAGDARRRAGNIEPDFEKVIVAGGDGTLNEVLNGFSDPSRIPIAVLPLGTANILAHELSLPRKPRVVAEAVDRGKVRWLDMGLVGDRRFLMLVSAGIDAMVTQEVSRKRRNKLGYLGYLFPVLTVLPQYRPPDLRVMIDKTKSLSGGFVLVSNTRNYGGIFAFADRAHCDSGHLDVCVFPKGNFVALLRYYFAALRGKVSTKTDVNYLTGRRIHIESREPVAVQVDGEPYGTTPVLVEIMPSSVPIIVPHEAPL